MLSNMGCYDHRSNTSREQYEANMASTTMIETVTITRPLKGCMQGGAGRQAGGLPSDPRALPPPVLPPPPEFATDNDMPTNIAPVIALICGLLVIVLMVLGLASADWLMAAGWRQGLFMHCIDPDAPTPLPFDIIAQPGCYAARPSTYIKTTAGLCVATLAADVCGSLLTGLGLRSTDNRSKFRYYRSAVIAMAIALFCILVALVIYPLFFAAELNLGNRSVWEFGWAYGVGWGAGIFLFGAVVLLLCDKESEELYYKERKVVQVESAPRP